MERTSKDLLTEIERELTAWHSTHPRATFAEIEAAVEPRIARLRAQLLSETVETTLVEEHPLCARCGATMVPRSHAERTVVVQGDVPVPLERSYVVCPVCGIGLFPPG
jgi:ribosomal protein S27AE